jgi:hypothetical protein
LFISLAAFVSFASCKDKVEEKSEPGKYSVTSPLLMDTSFTKDYVAQIQSFQNIEIRAKITRISAKIEDGFARDKAARDDRHRKMDQKIKADQIASLVKYCPGYASMSDEEKEAELQKLCPVSEFRNLDGHGFSKGQSFLLFEKPKKKPSSGRLKRFFSFNRRSS